MTYTAIPVGMLESNCYILNDGGALALVDCGIFSRRVRETIAAQGGDLRYILLTHGHFDHIQGVASAKAAYPGAQIGIGAGDAACLTGEAEDGPQGHRLRNPAAPDLLLRDGGVIPLNESHLRVIATPGHTRGGVSYLAQPEGFLFTGDTLFFEEVGRDDLPGGDWPTLRASVLRLYAILGECAVLPGHGQASSLEHERRCNPYVKL
ncbi:MAG: MBL fold metallo-hydrolase [Firmicutes bacterium]|nr:MBL fold metallo-hydrolase [Bacillota bacterium]